MKDEEINSGAFKEGLCYVKNYDGAFNGDPTDPCSAMEPNAVINSDYMGKWSSKTHAFLLHEDGTMDLCIYHDINYSNSLRQAAYMIFMEVRGAKGLEKGVWYEYPDVKPIALNSSKSYHHSMIGEMLACPGVDVKQFKMIDDKKCKL